MILIPFPFNTLHMLTISNNLLILDTLICTDLRSLYVHTTSIWHVAYSKGITNNITNIVRCIIQHTYNYEIVQIVSRYCTHTIFIKWHLLNMIAGNHSHVSIYSWWYCKCSFMCRCYTGQWSSASSNSWTPRTVALSWGTWSAQVSLIEDNAIIPELTKIES